MKIVQINVVYQQGSTGRIVETLHKEYLKRGIDSYVLYGRGPDSDDPRASRCSFLWEAKLWRFIALFTGNLYGGVPFSTLRIKKMIKKINPDTVHLHCINGNMVNIPSLMKWLQKRGVNTILTHHAEFMYTGGCGFAMCDKWKTGCEHCPHKKEIFGKWSIDRSKFNWNRFADSFKGFPALINIYVSPWLLSRAAQSPFLKGMKSEVILNPVDPSVFFYRTLREFPREIEGKDYVFLPISKFGAENKGTDMVEQIASLLDQKGFVLAVAGAPRDHVFSSGNIVNLGFVSSPQQMASLYLQARCTLIVSKVESFSMPVAESLCCGTPVVGFQAGGPESIALPDYSSFIEPGKIDELVASLIKIAQSSPDRSLISVQALKAYSASSSADSYLEKAAESKLGRLL